ncbi:MAG: hydrolase [Candidatus Omnitrophica bacterium]|nr:hydrolase [Candidatus Omnitrophota bacterium]
MFSPEKSVLLIIDVQEKLTPLMQEKDALLKNIQILIQAAQGLDIPILWSEHVPEKIGATVESIRRLMPTRKPIVKKNFGCCGEPNFTKALASLFRKQIIVAGIETHVCVYQTVAQLLGSSYKVQVVSDAVSSRASSNKGVGLERIRSCGGVITSTETILFELLQTAEHSQFRNILDLVR